MTRNFMVSAEDVLNGAVNEPLLCSYCDANVVLVNPSKNGRIAYFRTTANTSHQQDCPNYVDLNIDFEIDDSTKKNESQKLEILRVTNRVTLKIIEYFANNPEKLKRMDRRHFEELVAELFNGFGYEVELTKQTRDGGFDVIAISNRDFINQKYIIECKRPDPLNLVRLDVVKNLYATKFDVGANKAILVTTTGYTHDAVSFAKRHEIELDLKDFDDLIAWLWHYLKIKYG